MQDSEPSLSDITSGKKLDGEEHLSAKSLPGEDELAEKKADKPESVEAKTEKKPEPKSKAEPDKGKNGATAAPADSDAEVEPDDADPHPVPRKALIEERKKRQKAEQELANERAALSKRVAELEGQVKVYSSRGEPQAHKPDPKADEDAYWANPVAYQRQQMEAFQKQQAEQLSALQGRFDQMAVKQRIDISQEMMRGQHPDYDETIEVFKAAANENRQLWAQMAQSPNPAKYAYDYAKLQQQAEKFADLDAYEAEIRAKVRAEIEAEQREKSAKADADRVSTSSAGARSTGSAPVRYGDIPLKEIVNHRA